MVGLASAVIACFPFTVSAGLHPSDGISALTFGGGAAFLFLAAVLFWYGRWLLVFFVITGWIVWFVVGLVAAWMVEL